MIMLLATLLLSKGQFDLPDHEVLPCLLNGETVEAFNVAYSFHCHAKGVTKAQKDLSHYHIGFSKEEGLIVIWFVPEMTQRDLARHYALDLGIEVQYYVDMKRRRVVKSTALG